MKLYVTDGADAISLLTSGNTKQNEATHREGSTMSAASAVSAARFSVRYR
jgi:hypothetical protein